MVFKNRAEAGDQLAKKLSDLRDEHPLVLAIPRGAVPIAWVIASELNCDLDLVLVHKFGFANHPEFALGAVSEEGGIYPGEGAEQFGLTPTEIENLARGEIEKLRQKRALFTPHRKPIDPKGRLVVLVDDGIATGSTALAAIQSLKDKKVRRLVVATPVAPPDAVRRLQEAGAEVYSLLVPDFLSSVGEFYDDFRQVRDDEVIALLKQKSTKNTARPETGRI